MAAVGTLGEDQSPGWGGQRAVALPASGQLIVEGDRPVVRDGVGGGLSVGGVDEVLAPVFAEIIGVQHCRPPGDRDAAVADVDGLGHHPGRRDGGGGTCRQTGERSDGSDGDQ